MLAVAGQQLIKEIRLFIDFFFCFFFSFFNFDLFPFMCSCLTFTGKSFLLSGILKNNLNLYNIWTAY